MPLHNEYFSNAVEEQNKAAKLIGYIFPVPSIGCHDLTKLCLKVIKGGIYWTNTCKKEMNL